MSSPYKNRPIFLGITLCAALAMAAIFVSKTAPMQLPTMMLCLFLGMAAHSLYDKPAFKTGIDIASRTLLRLGIVLVGARIVFIDFLDLGWPVIATVIISIIAVMALGILGARALKIDRDLGFLIGGATAICGASAAMALSALLPPNKDTETKTAHSIIVVSAIGTLAMIAYPFLLSHGLSLSDTQAGLIIGGTIHDVGQVLGAGYTISAEAGDTALLVKLIRVAMLAPVLIICGIIIGMRSQSTDARPNLKKILPVFLVGFALMATLNSFALIPEMLQSWAKDGAGFLLKMALVAIGMKTSFQSLRTMGWKPIVLVTGATLFLLGLYIALITGGLI
jgi:uncharacterized integral membrane protein (TIGR00698 family)